MLAEALGEAGYTVITASDGRSGLEAFIAHADAVSAVVSDVAMPRMNGRDLLKEIRKINPEIPVLLITGQPVHTGATTDVTSAVRLLVKPFSPRILASAIREEIDQVRSRTHTTA
jgi:two-component system cell cycle sensor histidine kinase/response regulator CckA